MSMDKITDIKLETTAEYQSLSKLGVQFWNQDKGTAILQFNITRNNYPLGLSEENVKVFIALESGDSFLVDDNLDYVDELNGVVAYTIPDNFMRVASKVTGQVYVTTLDEEEVVVQRQFTFNVANDLIADLPAEDKIREIKYFSDMRAEVAQMMEKLNNDFANMNDYVTQVEQTTQDGITALTNLINTKQDAYNANHTAKMKELNDKGTEYSTKFDEDKEYMDDKFQAFQESVNGSGLITTGQSEDWQKYKLTSDDGKVQYLSKGTISNVLDLPTGIYETVSNDDATTQGLPVNNTYVQIKVLQMANNEERKIIEVTSTYNSKKWDRQLHTNGDRDTGWREVAYINPNNPFETVQGSQSKANTAENNAKQYTDEKVVSQHSVLFEGSVNGVGQTINMTESMFNYNLIIVSGSTPAGDFDRPVLVNQNSGNNIIINVMNLVDSNGNLGSAYELKLAKTNETTLTIANDVFFDYGTNEGSGKDANRFTIKRIEGWK